MAKKKDKAAGTAAGFDRSSFKPEDGKHYRIHFRNGHSGEYNGQALAVDHPFNWDEVVSVEEILPGPTDAEEVPKEE
jgi:hypothetical protein